MCELFQDGIHCDGVRHRCLTDTRDNIFRSARGEGDQRRPGDTSVRCYRRIEDLERIGLLKVKGSSKRNRTYSSNMEHMSLVINDDSMVLTTEFMDGGISNFDLNSIIN